MSSKGKLPDAGDTEHVRTDISHRHADAGFLRHTVKGDVRVLGLGGQVEEAADGQLAKLWESRLCGTAWASTSDPVFLHCAGYSGPRFIQHLGDLSDASHFVEIEFFDHVFRGIYGAA